MDETFTAGIEPGGLTEGREIRILICHILSTSAEPLGFSEMTEAVLGNGAANYFEFANALGELCDSGCVGFVKSEAGIKEYSVTEKGKAVDLTLSGDLPLSVREKAENSVVNILKRRRLAKENLVSVKKTGDGFLVYMRITDIGTDLMELSLFMPTEEQALFVKRKFLEDPAGTYTGVLSALAGEI